MFRIGIVLLASLFSLAANCQHSIRSKGLSLSVDEKLIIKSIYGNAESLPDGVSGYLIRVRSGDDNLLPIRTEWTDSEIKVFFRENIMIELSYSSSGNYLKLVVSDVRNEDKIDAILFGPFPTSVNETIGEIVGVVRGSGYAIGLQSLNAKTTGGLLSNSDGSDPARGTTAISTDFGSSLQAYCINRNKDRVYDIWNGRIKDAIVPKNEHGSIVGSSIALFGCKEDDVLSVIEEIELAEGLPYSKVNGVWSKRSVDANRPYLITTFTEENFDKALEITKKLGYQALYHSHPFKSWGQFELIEDQFPSGWDGMKECVDKAGKEGIRIGAHTLTNFITTNDAFVGPVPHKGLMLYSKTQLSRSISDTDTEIFIENPEGYDKLDNCQAVRLGDEIIRFAGISEDEPYRLVNCKRGQYNTVPQTHEKGSDIARLADHAYRVFFPNFEMQKELIQNLADFFNYTGVGQLDFDGHEGGWGTGEGEFGMDYFSEQLQRKVKHELRNGSSRSNHYYWHSLSYINWGEPWYGGFTKSQGHYRYQNQALLERNYIPNMLGWFLLNETTTLQEIEYMLARSAGYDAGYALTGSIDSFLANREFEQIAEAINTWEEARLTGIFGKDQVKLLRDVNNEFSLRKTAENNFDLQYFLKKGFDLHNLLVQPGQPNDVRVDFNVYEDQPLYIVFGAVGESGTIESVSFEVNGFETYTIEAELKPNWSLTYRGENEILVYDDVGRLKSKQPLEIGNIKLAEGNNMVRVSAVFSSGSELKLSGYISLKDKSETISPLGDIIE